MGRWVGRYVHIHRYIPLEEHVKSVRLEGPLQRMSVEHPINLSYHTIHMYIYTYILSEIVNYPT